MKKLVALFLALVFLLCACAEKSDVPTEQIEPSDTIETAFETEPSETAIQTKFGLSYLPAYGLNPYTCTATVNRAMFSLLYESLFVVSKQFRAEPVLCDHFTASEDGKTYRYTILSGVRFSDGSALTAEDVAASLRAAMESPLYAGRLKHIAEVTVESTAELMIVLDTAYENFSLMLDVPVVKAATVSENVPVGTGAYAVSDTLLRRNENWWQTQAPAVSVETIELYPATTPNEIRDAFEFGGTDLVYCDPNSAAAVGYRCDYEAWEAPTTVLHYIGFNLAAGLFTNSTLRTAVTNGIDRDALMSDVYGGFAQVAVLPCSPESDLYDAQLAENYAYAPEKFQSALYHSGVATSESNTGVFLVCADDPTRVSAAQTIAEQMKKAGLYLTVRALDREAYQSALEHGAYDLYYGEVRLTANFDLSEFFRSDGTLAYGAISDPSLAELCGDALENSGSYYDLCKQVMQKAHICPVVFKSYEICVTRGAISAIIPALDCVFHTAAAARTLSDADHSYESVPASDASSESKVGNDE